MVPSSSAMHGITGDQNVARDVAARVDAIRRSAQRWFTFAVVSVPVTGFGLWLLQTRSPDQAVVPLAMAAVPFLVWSLYVRARRVQTRAARLDRGRDVSWVSPRVGLVFFSDDVVFIEKSVGLVAFGTDDDVDVVDGTLILTRNASFSIETSVPAGWTDEDTAKIRDRVRRARRLSS